MSSKSERGCLLLGLLIELFAHPNHGVTIGYKNLNGKTIPVFRKTPQESEYALTAQGLQGIMSYAHDYGIYHSLHNCKCEQLLKHMKDNIQQWVSYPPKNHVEALKDLFLTSDWPIESNHLLIEQIKWWDIVTVIRLCRKVSSSVWPQATLTLAPVPVRVISRLSYRMYSFIERVLQLSSCLI
jgi:hypothetical protein